MNTAGRTFALGAKYLAAPNPRAPAAVEERKAAHAAVEERKAAPASSVEILPW